MPSAVPAGAVPPASPVAVTWPTSWTPARPEATNSAALTPPIPADADAGAAVDALVDAEAVPAVVWLVWSAASLACAEARADRALSTAAARVDVSSSASTSPVVTCWPTVTATLVTRPLTGKLTAAWLTAVTAPVEFSVASTLRWVTAAVR